MTRRLLVAWGCAALAALLALIYATSPVEVSRTDVQWSPTTGNPRSIPLALSAQSPEDLTVHIACNGLSPTSAGDKRTELFATSQRELDQTGLSLQQQGNQAWAALNEVTLSGTNVTVSNKGSTCGLAMHYSRSTQRVSVSAGQQASDNARSAPIAQPKQNPTGYDPPALVVDSLTVAPAAIGHSSVALTTQPTELHSSLLRWALALASLALAALTCFLSAGRSPRQSAVDEVVTKKPARWSLTDTLVSAVALASLVVVPPAYDDGWVLATARQFRELGFFSNYYAIEASPQPQGFWWSWLAHWWLSPLSTPAFLLRAPSLLLVVLAWWLVRRQVIDRIDPTNKAGRWVGAVLYSSAIVAFLVTLRPEPVIALLVATIITLVVRYRIHPESWVLGCIGWAVVAGVALHQTGWCVALASCAALPDVMRTYRAQGRRAFCQQHAALLVSVAAAGTVLILLGTNASLWWRSVITFHDNAGYQGLFREGARIQSLLESADTGAARLFISMVLLLSIVAFLARANRSEPLVTVAGWSAVGACLGLLLTSSKLSNHIGATSTALAVLTAIVVRDVVRAKSFQRATLCIVGLLVAAVAATNPLFTGARNAELLTDDWSLATHWPTKWLAISSIGFWLILAALGILIVLFLRSRGRAPLASSLVISTTLLAGTVVAAVMSPSLAQADQPASWVGQQRYALTGKPCGLAGEAGSAVPTQMDPLIAVDRPTDTLPVARETVTPPVKGVQTFSSVYLGPGRVSTDWYRLVEGSPSAAWIKKQTLGDLTYHVQYRDRDKRLLREDSSTRETLINTWMSVQIVAPAGATDVRITWSTTDGPQVVSSPVGIAASSTLTNAAGDVAVWSNPATYLQSSCLRLPSIKEGIVQPFAWSLGNPQLLGTTAGDRQIEIGCPVETLRRAERCVYRIKTSSGFGLKTAVVVTSE